MLTGDDIIYGTIGTLALFGNRSPSIFMVPADEISDDYLQRLQSYLEIVILGNDSVIPYHVDKKLKDIELKRIQSDSLFEESWLFTKLIWDNGTRVNPQGGRYIQSLAMNEDYRWWCARQRHWYSISCEG